MFQEIKQLNEVLRGREIDRNTNMTNSTGVHYNLKRKYSYYHVCVCMCRDLQHLNITPSHCVVAFIVFICLFSLAHPNAKGHLFQRLSSEIISSLWCLHLSFSVARYRNPPQRTERGKNDFDIYLLTIICEDKWQSSILENIYIHQTSII